MRATRDVRTLLTDLDPAKGFMPADEEVRRAELNRIVESTASRSSDQRRWSAVSRRTAFAAAAAAVAAVGVIWAVDNFDPAPQPGYVATPRLLSFETPTHPVNARKRLEAIAARARQRPAPTVPAGSVEHVKTAGWYLHSAVEDNLTTSAVVPQEHEIWRAADDRGRTVRRTLPPTFDSEQARRAWEDRFGWFSTPDGPKTQDYGPGRLPSRFEGAGRPPTDREALTAWLRTYGRIPDNADPVALLEQAGSLASERVLTPAETAALLAVVAKLRGLEYTGTGVDRAGRTGEAYSLGSDSSGLYTVHTIIVDPDTGRLLSYEETLTKTAGALNVRIPAVITYEVYLVSDHVPAPWR